MAKACTKCGVEKDLDSFSKDKQKKDGLSCWCSECRSGWRKSYLRRNGTTIKRNKKQDYLSRREYYKSKAKSYYRQNVDESKERNSEWKRSNPDKVNAYNQRRRARKRNADGTFTAEQWKSRLAYHENKCVYCGSQEDLQIEHQIPLSRGGTNWPSNLVPACRSCNCSKGTKTPKELNYDTTRIWPHTLRQRDQQARQRVC